MNEGLVKEFKQKAEALSAEVYREKDIAGAAQKIIHILKENSLQKVGCVVSGLPGKLPALLKKEGFEISCNHSPEEAALLEVGITPAEGGIADTGTIAQAAADLNTRLLSTLPLVHIVLLDTKNIAADFPAVLNLLQKDGEFDSYMALISGPSRTADIERVTTIGVHGPNRLIIILVDNLEESLKEAGTPANSL